MPLQEQSSNESQDDLAANESLDLTKKSKKKSTQQQSVRRLVTAMHNSQMRHEEQRRASGTGVANGKEDPILGNDSIDGEELVSSGSAEVADSKAQGAKVNGVKALASESAPGKGAKRRKNASSHSQGSAQ